MDSWKQTAYQRVLQHLTPLLQGEKDEIALMATIACELYHSIPWIDWIGFYRLQPTGELKVGPYQGSHACLTIPPGRGVCGKAVLEKAPQIIPDVRQVPWHIACSPSTLSEIVVPIFDPTGQVRAVLDADSNQPAAFDTLDLQYLQQIVQFLQPAYQ